ncbi:MAG: MBL fold metallo-hydrolase [Planctomycetaceae bacterium]
MRLEFLGTGGFHPNERRHTACIMLPEIGLVFDAGTSAFRIPENVQTDSLDIFLSHAHLDHVAGLTFLLTPMLMGDFSVRLIARCETLDAVQNHLLDQRLFPIKPPYEYIELADEMPVGGDGVLTHVPLKHPGGSVGYRIDWPDRSLAYITDTVADGSYTEFLRDVDVLIHECYFPDNMADWALKTGHSHSTPVAELAREVNAKQLWLVHVDPQRTDDDPVDLEAMRDIFPETWLAEDATTLEF